MMLSKHLVVFGFGSVSAISSAVAAWKWDTASRVPIRPQGVESVIETTRLNAWLVALMSAYSESASLNRVAARWSSFAALFGAIAVVVALF